jgi:hypothetical protein
MATFDYITKNRGSTKLLFDKIDKDENLDLGETNIQSIKDARNLNNVNHYLHTNALNKNTLRNSYVNNNSSNKDLNLVSENSIPATYSDKSKNKFLKPIRFIETLRNYLGDVFEARDIFVGNSDTSLNTFFELLKSLDDEKEESLLKKKGISREFSDDLVIYYIFYILEKLQTSSTNNEKKAEIMVRFLYIVAFYGVKVLAIDEYKQLVKMHDDLKQSFVYFFNKNKNAVTNALNKKNDFIGLQCKTFVDENLCGSVKSNYSKRTNMYRLFSSMQRCIYDDGTSEEIQNVLNNLGDKCDPKTTSVTTSKELSKKEDTLCELINRMKDCKFDEPVIVSDTDNNAKVVESVVSNKQDDFNIRRDVFGKIPIDIPINVETLSNGNKNITTKLVQ